MTTPVIASSAAAENFIHPDLPAGMTDVYRGTVRGKLFPRTPRNWQVVAGNVKLWCLTGASG